jgi:hypothetical protein
MINEKKKKKKKRPCRAGSDTAAATKQKLRVKKYLYKRHMSGF